MAGGAGMGGNANNGIGIFGTGNTIGIEDVDATRVGDEGTRSSTLGRLIDSADDSTSIVSVLCIPSDASPASPSCVVVVLRLRGARLGFGDDSCMTKLSS